MNEARTKRFSPTGWKYVNADGTLWPTDQWIKYSAKHPRPLSANFQAAKDPDLLRDPTPSPWNDRPRPDAPRDQPPVDQWRGQEPGATRYLAIITLLRPLAEKEPVGKQTSLDDYFDPKSGRPGQ